MKGDEAFSMSGVVVLMCRMFGQRACVYVCVCFGLRLMCFDLSCLRAWGLGATLSPIPTPHIHTRARRQRVGCGGHYRTGAWAEDVDRIADPQSQMCVCRHS